MPCLWRNIFRMLQNPATYLAVDMRFFETRLETLFVYLISLTQIVRKKTCFPVHEQIVL